MTSISFFRLLVASAYLCGLCIHPAYAEKADKDKPTNVEADHAAFDDLQQVNVFTGKVSLTRGSLQIRADKISVRQDPEGFQYASGQGSPVFFRQKRDGGDLYVEGTADRLEYDGKTQQIKLIGKAVLKKLDGTTLMEDVRGDQIFYDGSTEFYRVNSGQTASNPNNPQGRVRIVIQPKKENISPSAGTSSGKQNSAIQLKTAPSIANPRPE